ncbi:MAG: DUF3372 domain-containing protein [Proteobacteria bacterium]|nr:MAG: DUF3372 domain-containing protein [Pseudomonadota bacterium]
MNQAFLDLIRIRKESPLFRLRTGDEINARVHFLETELGSAQPPGLLIMEVVDEAAGANLDPRFTRMLVALNVTNETMNFSHASFTGANLEKLYGKGAFAQEGGSGALNLPPRSITIWGQR